MIVEQAGGIAMIGTRLVVRRTASGDWVLPKGHIEPGETAEQAAVREMCEETGLETAIVGSGGVVEFVQQGETRRVQMFLLRVIRELPSWTEHIGHDTFLVEASDASRLLTFSNTRRLWESIKDRTGSLSHQTD